MEGRMSQAAGNPGPAMSEYALRRLALPDSSAVAAILQECPEASRWSATDVSEFIGSGVGWAAEKNGRIVGFLLARAVADESEILNMAVGKAHRRHGIATELLKMAIQWLRSAGTSSIYLEVRASNSAAISLYTRHGFVPGGRRASYYKNPSEDAILMSRT